MNLFLHFYKFLSNLFVSYMILDQEFVNILGPIFCVAVTYYDNCYYFYYYYYYYYLLRLISYLKHKNKQKNSKK